MIENFREEESGNIDDSLLDELDDGGELDDVLLSDPLDPHIKSPLDPLLEDELSDSQKNDTGLLDEDEEEDMEYDSFDDHDEM